MLPLWLALQWVPWTTPGVAEASTSRVSDMLHGDPGFGLARMAKGIQKWKSQWKSIYMIPHFEKCIHFDGIFGFDLGPMSEPGLFHVVSQLLGKSN